MIRRFVLALGAALALAGCAAEEVYDSVEFAARAAYVPEGPPTVTLLTAISNSSGAGGHAALLIDGPQRVLYDPAGSWHHPMIPERGDVLYGMSPQFFDFYMDYHARTTYHMVVQRLEISPETAVALIAAVESEGAQAPANCARSVSSVLSRIPGFEPVSQTWFPRALMNRFETIPGVQTSRVYDDDSDDNLELLQRQARMARVAQEAQAIAGN
ncbi:hypothetical protein HKCCE3408_09975 [Rhodobacterales bacterium HKCCE3408]|nr:hypothetical protein [Rhodobacterales bacterium HKCCE3408]